jgi:uncharacterized protein (DUF1697 family)
MSRMFAFLRAINVGGRTVRMDRLREVFESIGFGDVETFIASGNVIFTTRSVKRDALERRIEKALAGALGWESDTFVRSAEELAKIARYVPFGPLADQPRGSAMHIAFMREPAPDGAHHAIREYGSETDEFHIHGRELYWLIRGRMSDSGFSAARLEKILGGPVTARNVNTVRRLTARYISTA